MIEISRELQRKLVEILQEAQPFVEGNDLEVQGPLDELLQAAQTNQS